MTASCVRMGFFIDPLHVFGADVRVNLRGAEVLVAEQRLDAPQVRAGVQQMRRERVAEFVRGQVGRESGLREVELEEPLERTRGEATAELVQEDGGARRLVGRQRSAVFEVGAERALGGIAEGAEAFLLAFAANLHYAGKCVDIAEVQAERLADAESAGVNDLQDRAVSYSCFLSCSNALDISWNKSSSLCAK